MGTVYDRVMEVDTSIYQLDVIVRAAYRLTDRFYVYLSRPRDGIISVALARKPNTSVFEKSDGELANLLLDEAIRLAVRVETADVREHMLRCALKEVTS